MPTIPFLLLSCSLFLLSCNNENDNNKEANSTAMVDYDSLNNANSLNLTIRHNAIPYWQDSVAYSYVHENRLEGNTIPFKGYIIDIVKRGDEYILSVEGSGKTSVVAFMVLDSIQLRQLNISSNPKNRKGIFIMKVNKIIPSIEDRVVVEGVYGDEADLKHELSRYIQIKGSLIDFYINKRQP